MIRRDQAGRQPAGGPAAHNHDFPDQVVHIDSLYSASPGIFRKKAVPLSMRPILTSSTKGKAADIQRLSMLRNFQVAQRLAVTQIRTCSVLRACNDGPSASPGSVLLLY